jgi:hypothetical protein
MFPDPRAPPQAFICICAKRIASANMQSAKSLTSLSIPQTQKRLTIGREMGSMHENSAYARFA